MTYNTTLLRKGTDDMTTLPPLPEPGLQSPDDRRAISRRFIQQAREELAYGNRLQAGEKAWGAIAHQLKLFGEQRGWRHTRHEHLKLIGNQILAEYRETQSQPDLAVAFEHAFFVGHKNFYENQYDFSDIEETITLVEDALPLLEAIQAEPPRPFAITSNTQRRRLAELTGNRGLQVGDASPVGFSLRHQPDSTDGRGQGS